MLRALPAQAKHHRLSVVVSLSLLYEVIRRSTGAGPGLIDKCGFH